MTWTLRLPAYATRVLCHLVFRQDKGFTVKQATLVVLIFGIGAAIGGLIGGILGQKAYNRNPRLLPLFIGACQVMPPPMGCLGCSCEVPVGPDLFFLLHSLHS